MPKEAPRLPEFNAQTANDVINDLAGRARKAEISDGEYAEMPHHLRLLERNRLFMAMLEIRANERLNGRNVDVDLHKTGKKDDYDNTLLDIHLDGSDSDYDHEFSQNEITLYAGYAILHTTVADLAASRELTSLDVLKLIGKPTQETRGGESPKTQIERYLKELNLINVHKKENPESAQRMDEIAKELALRLITLRKLEPNETLAIGTQTLDIETGEANMLFTLREPSYWGDPTIIDYSGKIYDSVGVVKSTDELEDALATDIVGPYVTKPGLQEYDFWVMPVDNRKNVVTWNKKDQTEKTTDQFPYINALLVSSQ